MTPMHIALYVIWFLIPIGFFLIALWSRLEQMSGKDKRENPADFLRQGFFVLGCVFVSIVIDQLLLEGLWSAIVPPSIPLGFFQIMLLPVVLYIAALTLGPSTPIRIVKAPSAQNRKRR